MYCTYILINHNKYDKHMLQMHSTSVTDYTTETHYTKPHPTNVVLHHRTSLKHIAWSRFYFQFEMQHYKIPHCALITIAPNVPGITNFIELFNNFVSTMTLEHSKEKQIPGSRIPVAGTGTGTGTTHNLETELFPNICIFGQNGNVVIR